MLAPATARATGPLLETFTVNEISRQLAASGGRMGMFHYRTTRNERSTWSSNDATARWSRSSKGHQLSHRRPPPPCPLVSGQAGLRSLRNLPRRGAAPHRTPVSDRRRSAPPTPYQHALVSPACGESCVFVATMALDRAPTLSIRPPDIVGGAIVVPQGLLDRLAGSQQPAPTAHARNVAEVDRRAVDAVLATERSLDRKPKEMPHNNEGYDIESRHPDTGDLYFIEVKGRIEGADTVTVSRSQIIHSQNSPDRFILDSVLTLTVLIRSGGGPAHRRRDQPVSSRRAARPWSASEAGRADQAVPGIKQLGASLEPPLFLRRKVATFCHRLFQQAQEQCQVAKLGFGLVIDIRGGSLDNDRAQQRGSWYQTVGGPRSDR